MDSLTEFTYHFETMKLIVLVANQTNHRASRESRVWSHEHSFWVHACVHAPATSFAHNLSNELTNQVIDLHR